MPSNLGTYIKMNGVCTSPSNPMQSNDALCLVHDRLTVCAMEAASVGGHHKVARALLPSVVHPSLIGFCYFFKKKYRDKICTARRRLSLRRQRVATEVPAHTCLYPRSSSDSGFGLPTTGRFTSIASICPLILVSSISPWKKFQDRCKPERKQS
eukprot:SAG31_NODE_699_length_12741_cov_5.762617_5_plen_154_part_00